MRVLNEELAKGESHNFILILEGKGEAREVLWAIEYASANQKGKRKLKALLEKLQNELACC